ncbi:MAG: methyltransferase family protein, partial [Bryobacteraceae bacterium]
MNAYQRTAALKAAIDLNLFTAIAEGAGTTAALAARCGASERGARILCDFLTTIGFLTKQDGLYSLTLDSSVFLDRRSPAYLGSAVEFLNNSTLTAGFSDLAGAVRKGGTTISEEGTVAPENPMWVEFARAMAPVMVMPAKAIASFLGAGVDRVLDIAAGHGLFGIEIALATPGAEITAL